MPLNTKREPIAIRLDGFDDAIESLSRYPEPACHALDGAPMLAVYNYLALSVKTCQKRVRHDINRMTQAALGRVTMLQCLRQIAR